MTHLAGVVGQVFIAAPELDDSGQVVESFTGVAGDTPAILFDTGGQDVFADLMPQYWEGADGVVLVFDVTRPDSLHACEAWYNRLREALQRERLPAVLVGNKADGEVAVRSQEASGDWPQQLISGVSIAGYWAANFLWDATLYTVLSKLLSATT